MGGVQEAAGRCFSLIGVSGSLSLSLPPLREISIKYIYKKTKQKSWVYSSEAMFGHVLSHSGPVGFEMPSADWLRSSLGANP